MQDIDCKVSIKDPFEVIEGGESNLQSCIYKMTVRRHDDPPISETGHYWEVVELERHDQRKQLV
jgi:hypothetical protein